MLFRRKYFEKHLQGLKEFRVKRLQPLEGLRNREALVRRMRIFEEAARKHNEAIEKDNTSFEIPSMGDLSS